MYNNFLETFQKKNRQILPKNIKQPEIVSGKKEEIRFKKVFGERNKL